jgi:DNA-binding response OmpR family regulator
MERSLDPVKGTPRIRVSARPRPLLVVAEDDAEIRLALVEVLARAGFDVRSVSSGELLIEELARCRQRNRLPAAVVLDHRMPGHTGLELLRALRTTGWTVPVIMITAFGKEVVDAAKALGADAVFEKPFDPEALVEEARAQVERARERAPFRMVAAENPTCASCSTSRGVGRHWPFADVYFCDECWERASPPHPDDELGVVD